MGMVLFSFFINTAMTSDYCSCNYVQTVGAALHIPSPLLLPVPRRKSYSW